MLENQVLWKKRFDALSSVITTTRDSYSQQHDKAGLNKYQSQSVQRLLQVIDCLKVFASSQFNYFFNGFTDETLVETEDYPPEHVLETTLDQIAFDIRVISQALSQRFSQLPAVYDTLALATELSERALAQIKPGFQLEQTQVVTYLQKSPTIRVIPYAKVALIGVPYTAISVKQDFLAIPHEIGHFVFWQGILNNNTLAQDLNRHVAKRPEWSYAWLEEIFADVFGCLIAGPTITLSFQDLQLQSSKKDFLTNDEEHPVPILRPLIYSKILNKKKNFRDWAIPLNTRWVGKMDGRKEYIHKNGHSARVDKAISNGLDIGNMPVDKIIEKVSQILEPGIEAGWWSDNLPPIVDIGALYKKFDEIVEQLPINASAKNVADIVPADYEVLKNRWLGHGREIQQKHKDYQPWISVLRADGWATKGPDDNPTSG